MARPNLTLIEKLRQAAKNLESGDHYNWGHVSHCNCGHLARCLTDFSAEDIYRAADASLLTEWSEYANDYCPLDGAPIDNVIDTMIAHGLTTKDIQELEYLSNRAVLEALPGGYRSLRRGDRASVALYMRTWAALMELELKAATPTRKSTTRELPVGV